jgi:hypothetical protein
MAGVTGDTESGDVAVGLLDAVVIEAGLILGRGLFSLLISAQLVGA